MSDRELVCEIIKSSRGNPKLHVDGYTYQRNRSVRKIVYWICEHRRKTQCKSTATTKTIDNEYVLVRKPGRHNHPRDPLKKKIEEFKAKLKERVAEGIDITDLINDSQVGVQFDVLEHLPSENALRQLIYREKNRQKEPIFEEILVKKPNNSNMRSKNVSNAQLEQLLELLGEDGVLENGRVAYSDSTKLEFWKRVAFNLNSIDSGAHKNAWQWCKVWTDWKNRTQKKANILLNRKTYIGPKPTDLEIDELEMKLLKLIEYPLDDKEDLMKLEMVQVTKKEVPEAEDSHNNDNEFLLDNFILQSEHDQDQSDKEEDQNFEDDDNNQYLDDTQLDDGDDGNDKLFELPIESEESDGEEKGRRKRKNSKASSGPKMKKRKLSIEEYKLKAQIELEQERQEQKKEELRLRAIELKLKGDELRLKEMEMNKVKYLTNIEEEKLKCFREISASLKEFLEMSRNGNMRLHSSHNVI